MNDFRLVNLMSTVLGGLDSHNVTGTMPGWKKARQMMSCLSSPCGIAPVQPIQFCYYHVVQSIGHQNV